MEVGQIQLGKNGLTENFISTLKNNFKKNKSVRISVLKSAGHDKNQVKEYSEKILERLGKNYTSRVIGFTIVLKKWRRDIR
ncbi:MAG: YhbY family RNA-binding protein [Nanoarchaeota archaeon]|nr:YhbY family RNA-binding protein [Nanoarchaeota archaeon]